ncbi:RNA-binding motif protein, X-linked 2 [Conger conger]|uniref:RNA-binding motif protein, X-linked 2 n=1 Tax=Conger conger TaxID=82655 RepID=UPI002A5AFE09|nr:RNA-binding motif protein, X-linked 2 [Conger conger]
MNPLTKVKLINELNDREAQLGVKESVSWHSEYRDSAWIFIGGFPYELTEGDIICVFSQYGEIANINLVRDKKTGKSKGFCFICYEDQRSTILAVDNFNGIKIKGRTIRVDHVKNYRPPKDSEDIDDITKQLREDGCAPQRPPSSSSESEEEEYAVVVKKQKKDKKEKKKKKKEKKEKKRAVEERRDGGAESAPPAVRVKREREDSGYDKYAQQGALGPRAEHEDRAPGDRHGDRRTRRDEREPKMERHQRERETDRERDRVRDTDRERDRGRERERDRETDRDRGRERDLDRERERDKEKDREKSGSYRERSRDREHRRN